MLIRHVQRAFLIVGAVFAALLFFLGGAALRLLMGPVSLGPFAGIVEDALNHSVSGVVIRFDQVVLEWSRADGKVNLIVLGTKVFDLDGHIIAQAPKADLDFDAAAMVAGHLNLKRFSLIGIQLTGVRSREGAIRLGFGREQDEPDLLETIRNILANSATGGGSLESFAIRNARLAFRDEPTGLFIIAPNASFTLDNKSDHFDASLDSAVEISGAPGRIVAHAVLRPDGTPKTATVAIKGLSIPALVQNSSSFKPLAALKLVSDVAASFSLDQNGELLASSFRATGGGMIETTALRSPVRVEKFDTEGRFDGPNKRLTLDAISFTSKEAALKGNASLAFGWKEGALETISGNVEADNFRLDMPDWLRQPLVLSRLSFEAAYDLKTRKLSWERAIVKGGALSGALNGSAVFTPGGSPSLSMDGSIEALSVADALKYWPLGVAESARSWIADNIGQGRIGPLLIKADLPAHAFDASSLPDDALDVTFPFEGLTARYIAGMTPITGARGDAKLTGDTFHVTVTTAAIGPLAVSNGDVAIPDLHTTGALTRIRAHSEGTMVEVLRLIDEEPLGYPKRFGINPANVAGHAVVDLDFSLPLLKDLTLDQLRIGVQAKATDLALPVDNRKLDHGMVSFAIDSKSLTSQGTANISNVPVTFKWTEDFTAPGVTTRIDLAGRLDETTRANLGLSDPKWLTGSMPTTLVLTGRRFHFDEGALKSDLTNAAAAIPVLNFVKRAGVAANATAQLRFADGGAIAMNDLVVTGEGLNVRGGLALDAAGKIVNVSLSNLRSGKNDFAMDLAPMQGGGFAVRFQGKSLDATHFFGDTKKTPNAPAPAETDSELQEPLSLSARTDKLIFHDDLGFRDVTLAVSFAAHEKLTAFNLDAIGTGKGKVTGRMTVVKGVRNLVLDTDDAGAFIETFTGFGSIRGGTLAARVSFPGDAPAAANAKAPPPDYQGTVTLSDFIVTDQPFVARLFSIGSLDGPLRLLQGQGIQITTMSAPFSARGKMVTIREGRASGAAIGATFAGSIDRKTERVDVTGTLVPVYGLNSVLGAVPILGDILISKKGEGIFGLTYAMKGSLNEPSLTVNPLSVLTPGIFRRIFEFDPPKEEMPPPQTPPQASVEAAPNVVPSTP